MLKGGARIRRIAGHFDDGMHDWPSEEERNGTKILPFRTASWALGHLFVLYLDEINQDQ